MIAPAAPAPLPTPADREPAHRPGAAHPFAELLQHNRLEAARGITPAAGAAAPPTRPANGDAAAAQAEPSPPITPAPREATAADDADAADGAAATAAPADPAAGADRDDAEPAAAGAKHAAHPGGAGGTATAAAAAAASLLPAPSARSAAPGRDELRGGSAGREHVVDATRSRDGRGEDPRLTAALDDARPAAAAGHEARADLAAGAAKAEAWAASRPPADAATGAAALPAPLAALTAPSAAPVGAAAPSATAPSLAVPVPVDSPGFAGAFAVQVSVLARDGIQHAELHLNPAEMGPVSIRIALDGTQARVDFGADVAATRAAIERGLPELAGALRDAGFTLSGGGVSAQSQRGDGGREDNGSGRGRAAGGSGGDGALAGPAAPGAARRLRIAAAGGVDLYA